MAINGLNLGSKPETADQDESAQTDAQPKAPDADIESQEPADLEPPLHELEAERVAEDSMVQTVRWSCHPTQRFTVGDFQFENGLLELSDPNLIDKFERIYNELPVYEQARLKKLDLQMAEKISKEFLSQGGATKQIDSSVGDRNLNTQVGVGDLLAQQA